MYLQNKHIGLSRKYRPQKFSDLIGHELMVKILTNSTRQNKVSHAILLTGMRGVGKTTIARLIAKSMNCIKKEAGAFDNCNECVECLSISEGSSADVVEMDAASNTSVNDIREIIESSRYKPISSKYKIFIIDEVHMLSGSAFNALLKTLEEPPHHVKFIFATTESHKIPLTITSRCQRFHLNRLSLEQLTEYYRDIAKRENVVLGEGVADLIASAADGSVRDGLSILDQVTCLYDDCDEVSLKDVKLLLGYGELDIIHNLLHSVIKKDIKFSLSILNDVYWSGYKVSKIISDLMTVLHDITKCKVLNQDSKGDHVLFKSIEDFDIPHLMRLWDILFEESQRINVTNNEIVAAEMLIMKLCLVDFYGNFEEIIKNLEDNIEHIGNTEVLNSSVIRSDNVISSDGKEFSINSVVEKQKNYDKKVAKEDKKRLFDMIAEIGDIELYSVIRNDVAIDYLDFDAKKIEITPIRNDILSIAKRIGNFDNKSWSIKIKSASSEAKNRSESYRIDDESKMKYNNMLHHKLVKGIVNEIDGIEVEDVVLNQ